MKYDEVNLEESKSNRDIQAELSKQKLFNSAFELFSKRPYHKVKIRDICNDAGVSVGLFYHYFLSKEALYNETFVYYMNHDKRSYDVDSSNPIDSIKRIIATNISGFVEMGPIFTNKFLVNELLTNYEYLNDDSRKFNKAIIQCIDNAIEHELLYGNQGEIAQDIFHVLKGIGFNWAINGGNFDFIAACIRMVDIIIANYSV
ncbi:TetR/AcrR family transcriptional regulator [Facklamia sp. P13069]|uniref:TetR/AcrR family transcriptional regulator n=1 Tax=unclassified Facklamia TaxID=2622293 RepID=UPI003D16ABED